MAAQFTKHFVQDLTQDIKIRQCGTIVFNADNLSNVISVELYNGTEPYSGGGTVAGACICPDGSTVPLTGSLSGNTASVILTGGCFAFPGQIGIGVQVVIAGEGSTEEEIELNTIKTTVLKAIYNVELYETDNVVDPGSRLTISVTDLVNDIDTAVASIPADYSDLLAAIAPTFSTSTAYSAGAFVWYEGNLYRFITAHAAGSWIGTDAEAAVVGTEIKDIQADVSDLKSTYYAIGTEQDFSYLSAHRNGYYIKNDGTTEEENNMLAHTDYIAIPTNAISVTCGNRTSNTTGTTTYRISPNILFYDANKTFISYDVADASITKPTYNIPSGAKYCIINQPSAVAKAAAGIAFIRFNSAEIKNGLVGTYAGAFTAASQQIQTGIQLKAGVLYSIVVNTAITARINIFPHADSSKMIRAFAPGSYPLCVASDTTLDLYNGTYGYTGDISVNVVRQGYIDDALTKVPMVYEVGGTSPIQSFTALLLALKNDDREKIIYINGGDYDIFQEYTDLGLLSRTFPNNYRPAYDYFDYCVWVPKNTHIIGRGLVRLLWQPTTSQISAEWSKTVSVINAGASMTLENVEIHVKNGRYCIHDDPLGKGAYTGARKIYKNVKCYKFLNDEGYGFNPVIGCGIDREMYYEFDNCLFKSEANQNAFYMHSRAGTEDMPSLTKSLSSNVVVKDCIMITTGRGVALGNVANSSAQRIRVDFYNCYISGTFNVGDESAYTSGNNSNVFDITLNQCTAPMINIADPNNIYPANIYN